MTACTPTSRRRRRWASPAGPARSGRPPGRTRLGLDTAYLLLGLPAGIIAFTVVVTGWATALGLAITLIGLPVAMATIVVSRGMAERRALARGARPRHAGPRPLPAASRSRQPPADPRILERLKALFADAQTWKDLGWHLLLLPIGIVGFTVAVVCWAWTLGPHVPLWFTSRPTRRRVGGVTVDAW